MTRRNFRECDICGEEIAEEKGYLALVLKRSLLGRLRVGLRKFVHPWKDTPQWIKKRFDLCTHCREKVVRRVKREVSNS